MSAGQPCTAEERGGKAADAGGQDATLTAGGWSQGPAARPSGGGGDTT